MKKYNLQIEQNNVRHIIIIAMNDIIISKKVKKKEGY